MSNRPGNPVPLRSDISPDDVSALANFFERQYTQTYGVYIEPGSFRKTDLAGTVIFSWNLYIRREVLHAFLQCELKISVSSVELSFKNLEESDTLATELRNRTIDGIQNMVSVFVQRTRINSLFFVLGVGEKHSEAPSQQSMRRGLLRRVLSGNTSNVFLLITFVSFILLFTIGLDALFVLIAVQFVYLLYSDRAILNMGKVRPSSDNPYVSIVSVRTKPDTVKFLRQHGRKMLSELKEEVDNLHVEISAGRSSPELQDRLKSSIISILSHYGMKVTAEEIGIKTRNVYEIVEKAARKFHQPVPKIVIANSIVSNASATGVSKRRSSMMITAGSLEDLSDDELESTVGHELGHIKGHDSAILFGVTSFQFVGLFYLWYPLVLYLGIFYFVIVFAIIFAIGKVLETRADTESAIVLKTPETLASSLSKIGSIELYYEKYSAFRRVMAWFRFDPHPPVYFRVNRMSEFEGPDANTAHAMLISIKDCVVGFVSAFGKS